MKIKPDFMLRKVAGSWVVVAVGMASVDFNGMLTLNESGSLLWNALTKDTDREQLIGVLTENYEVSASEAGQDVDEFLSALRRVGCLEE